MLIFKQFRETGDNIKEKKSSGGGLHRRQVRNSEDGKRKIQHEKRIHTKWIDSNELKNNNGIIRHTPEIRQKLFKAETSENRK